MSEKSASAELNHLHFDSEVPPVFVTVDNLTYQVRKGASHCQLFNARGEGSTLTLLDRVDFCAKPGTLVAIVGPSGSGKTTLLNVVAKRSPPSRVPSGRLLYNGKKETRGSVKTFINYVMAHDKGMPYLSVEETLLYAAGLKLPDMAQEERRKRVEALLQDVGLTGCKDTYVGCEWKKGISSGELKRLSIAVELLDNPSVLLLDEPTSGLDSALSLKVMEILVREARKGRTVITTIHQPSSQVFKMLDHLVLLCRGTIVYHGPAASASSFFARQGYDCGKGWNPADYFLELVSEHPDSDDLSKLHDSEGTEHSTISTPEDGEEAHLAREYEVMRPHLSDDQIQGLKDFWRASPEAEDVQVDIQRSCQADPNTTKFGLTPVQRLKKPFQRNSWRNWAVQVSILWRRAFLNSIRNPFVAIIMLLIQAMQGLILGGIFYKHASGVVGVQPLPQLPDSFLENSWVNAFVYGVDGHGKRPFVEILENGVDNHGGFIVDEKSRTAMNNKPDFSLAPPYDILKCVHDHWRLSEVYPQSYGWAEQQVRRLQETSGDFDDVYLLEASLSKHGLGTDFMPPRVDDTTIAVADAMADAMLPAVRNDSLARAVSMVLMGMQIFDYVYLHYDNSWFWPCYEDFYINHPEAAMDFYGCALDKGNDLLSTFTLCSGLPPVPRSFSRRRRLVPAGNSINEAALRDFIGPELSQFIDAAKELLDKTTNCDNEICRFIKDASDKGIEWGRGTIMTIITVLGLSGCLFFSVANLGFASYDALLTFPQERALFNRETANGLYGASSYYIAKNLADMPFQLLPSLVLGTIYYWMVGLAGTATQFFVFFGISGLSTFAAYGFGYMVSAASPRMEIAILVAPLTLVVWLVLAGFFLRDADIPIWIDWFKYLSFYRWGFFALIANQFPISQYFGALPNDLVLQFTGVTETRLWVSCVVLLCLGVGYRVIGFVFLAKTNRKVGMEA